MNIQEEEPGVEFTHTIKELLEPFASKDHKDIKAFLTTTEKHTVPRLSLWGLATLYLCNPEEYPEASRVPEIKSLREERLTEMDKRLFLAQKAIDEIRDITSYESRIEFKLMQLPSNATLRSEDDSLSMISGEIAALTEFRQALGLRKGAGPSAGEAPGKSSL